MRLWESVLRERPSSSDPSGSAREDDREAEEGCVPDVAFCPKNGEAEPLQACLRRGKRPSLLSPLLASCVATSAVRHATRRGTEVSHLRTGTRALGIAGSGAAVLLLCAGIAGCRSKAAPANSEEALRIRVTAFWDLKLKRDVVGMYDFLEESFRDRNSLADYVGSVNRDLKYFEYKIEKIDMEGEKATAFVSFTWQLPEYVLKGLKPTAKLMKDAPEVWQVDKGVWNRQVDQGGSAVARSSRKGPPDNASKPSKPVEATTEDESDK